MGLDGEPRGREDVIARVVRAARAGTPAPAVRDVTAAALGPNVALVRYVETDAEGRDSARASIWTNEPLAPDERVWRMRFHQATPRD